MKLHILNEAGELDGVETIIKDVYAEASTIAREKLDLDTVDVIVRSQPEFTIPELGVGGFTDISGHAIYLSIDPSKKLKRDNLLTTLVHEFHHAARFQKIGYKHNLANSLIQEGLACLFEEDVTGQLPIYAAVNIDDADKNKAVAALEKNHDGYKHEEWFFGTGDIKRWFGYAYGYQICKEYAAKKGLDATQFLDISADAVWGHKN